ncbi:hypothetical protein RSWS8N_15254 [Cereibacter sphaeroides WS8N]|nr:hypothetical protein RSWS8N_15254 [Cereibacter sphaeroides WS8N]
MRQSGCSVLRAGRDRFYDFEDGAGLRRRAPARAMIHLRYMAEDGWTGRSPLEVAAESVGLALAGQESAARAASGVTARAVIRFRDDYEDDEARVRSARRVAAALRAPEVEGFRILGEGEDVQTLDMKAADQELLGSRKFDREQIAAIYRVPPAKLAAPSSPDGPADALRCAQDFIACDCTGGVRFSGFGVLPRRDDGPRRGRRWRYGTCGCRRRRRRGRWRCPGRAGSGPAARAASARRRHR